MPEGAPPCRVTGSTITKMATYNPNGSCSPKVVSYDAELSTACPDVSIPTADGNHAPIVVAEDAPHCQLSRPVSVVDPLPPMPAPVVAAKAAIEALPGRTVEMFIGGTPSSVWVIENF